MVRAATAMMDDEREAGEGSPVTHDGAPDVADDVDVAVVGAGLAGLSASLALREAGRSVVVLEASDAVGGRARTDEVDGFLLDRGFQVLLDSYEYASSLLDMGALKLRRFEPGALIWWEGRLHRVVDPLRKPTALLRTLRAPVGGLAEKLRLLALRRFSRRRSDDLLGMSAADLLERFRLDGELQERFLRPFFSGVFLDRSLRVSAEFFRFIFDRFSRGRAALPAAGMGAIARQLADRLAPGSVRLRTRVDTVAENGVISAGPVQARRALIATDPWSTPALTGGAEPPVPLGVTTLYFATETPPFQDRLLALDGTGEGPVNHMCVPSVIAPTYAPNGAHLVSTTVIGLPEGQDADLESQVRTQMSLWFGERPVADWRHLRTMRIPRALPLLTGPPPEGPASYAACGDYLEHASIEGALVSGRRAAERILG